MLENLRKPARSECAGAENFARCANIPRKKKGGSALQLDRFQNENRSLEPVHSLQHDAIELSAVADVVRRPDSIRGVQGILPDDAIGGLGRRAALRLSQW